MTPPPHRQRSLSPPFASLALCALTVAVYALVRARQPDAEPADLVAWGALERSRVWHGELHRLVVAAFLHADGRHLAMNLAGLGGLGFIAERALGTRSFLLVWLASVVGGSALSLVGRDAVAVGGSAGVFGIFGALLVVNVRKAGGLRPFLASLARLPRGRPGWRDAWLAVAAVLALAALAWLQQAIGADLFPADHLAHAGGLAAGTAAALAATAPPPRLRPGLLVTGGVLALVAAAAWPRPGLTEYQGRELRSAIHAALRARDPALARKLLAEAEQGGLRSGSLDVYRALVLVQEGDLESGLAGLRPLLASESPPLRDEARRQVAVIARMLGYRYYTGDGRPRDPFRALAFLDESCTAGDSESCSDARRIRGQPPGPAAP